MEIVPISPEQYNIVYNLLSLTIAAMTAAGLFFIGSTQQVAPKYRPALLISSLVVFIAAYHYYRIFESWGAAYVLEGGMYVSSGVPFNDAYRYADWLITVPLLLVELVYVMGLSRQESWPLIKRLSLASVLMLLLGYPGEISNVAETRWLFWSLAMVPFIYILWVLFVQISRTITAETGEIKGLITGARSLLLVSWMVYPIAFIFPMIGLSGPVAEVGLQVGYSIADLTAKAFFGVMIFQIARAKSDADGYVLGSTMKSAA